MTMLPAKEKVVVVSSFRERVLSSEENLFLFSESKRFKAEKVDWQSYLQDPPTEREPPSSSISEM